MSDFTTRIIDSNDRTLAVETINQSHLIEANAGTGKTYSIQTIYLRLILIEGLTVQQILTVTFTKDATKELRDRLQGILREALAYAQQKQSSESTPERTKRIVDHASTAIGHDAVEKRLQLALIDFDLAAIFTIHGFCQRILKRFAFETGQGFDIEPATNADEEIEQLCKDWWRQHIYTMEPSVAFMLAASGKFSLSTITELAQKLIAKPDAKVNGVQSSIADLKELIQNKLTDFVQNNRPTAEETAEYPNALPDIAREIKYLQNKIKAFRDYAASDPRQALQALADACNFESTHPIGCVNAVGPLKDACDQFMLQVPKGTRKNAFSYDNGGHLTCANCPDLEALHTEAVMRAAGPLSNLESIIEQYAPLSLKQNASFDSLQLLIRHFFGDGHELAPDVFAAIKKVSDSKRVGIAETTKCSLSLINKTIAPLYQDLISNFNAATYHAAEDIKRAYQRTRTNARTASFNDYLVNLRKALEVNPDLTGLLRHEFKAALIDEFQDTDPIQWGIFKQVFYNASIPCFLVGDPKQAIYRFRNGDIQTYLGATREVTARYELTTNFRSEDNLIAAVNQIFKDPEASPETPIMPTFGEGITFTESQPPNAAEQQKLNRSPLTLDGQIDPQPFKVLLLDSEGNNNVPGTQSPKAMQAYRLTAQAIAKILSDPKLRIGDNPIRPGDIAVLVKRHREANGITAELKKLKIPSVRQGAGDVWQTDEGQNLWAMLESVLDPQNINKLRIALLTNWTDLSREHIHALNQGQTLIMTHSGNGSQPMAMEDFVALFMTLNETWTKRGFPAMFRKLLDIFSVKQRLLANPDQEGQRRIANINHLAELVEARITEDRKSPDALLAWIRRQFSKDRSDGGEEVKLRLETDDNAVQIMTIFTSKGLQFPIVFAPTLFMMKPRQTSTTCEYHTTDEARKLNIYLKTGDKTTDDAFKQRETQEVEDEQVRQIYVAMTRGIHRTVVFALKKGCDNSKSTKDDAPPQTNVQKNIELVGLLGERTNLQAICQQSHNAGTIEVIEAQEESCPPENHNTSIDIMAEPPSRPVIDTSKGHGSFSSIAPHVQHRKVTADIFQDDPKGDDGESETDPPADPDIKPQGIFDFPPGARTGNCWHELFEHLDFQTASDEAIREITTEKLQTYGFLKDPYTQAERIEVTTNMVKRVLHTPLPQPSRIKAAVPFTFADIANQDRLNEWEFNFRSATDKATSDIKKAIEAFPQYKPFIHSHDGWENDIPGGYITGFVDLLFRHNGIYFIADWKSNRRTCKQTDFTQDGMQEEISDHGYWLQYLLYTVAVHQYLASTLPGYHYEQHYGGVYYVFLRGVDGQRTQGHTHGIYYDRPPLELIKKLASILGDFA